MYPNGYHMLGHMAVTITLPPHLTLPPPQNPVAPKNLRKGGIGWRLAPDPGEIRILLCGEN